MSTYQNILKKIRFNTPEHWHQIKTIDMHTGGEPLRVIVEGFPEIKGNSVLECRRYVKENYDWLRTALMFEPRGHADMYGVLLLPPFSEEADFGVLFLHNEGYSTMCGHATIAITKLAVLQNWITVKEGTNVLKIDAPCGVLTSYAVVEQGEVVEVYFDNVPSFVVALEEKVKVPGIGEVTYDLAYGGAFYAYVAIEQFEELGLGAEDYTNLIAYGMEIKNAVIAQKNNIIHPEEEDLSFLYGTIFTGSAKKESNHSRNVCVFAEREVDRSPTGSGVSGRAAIHHAKKELKKGQTISIESILGSEMTTCVQMEMEFAGIEAIIPRVGGTAYVTGQNEFVIDPDDPFANGFLLR